MRTTRSSASRQSSSSLSLIGNDNATLLAPMKQPPLLVVPQRGLNKSGKDKLTRAHAPPTNGAPASTSRSDRCEVLQEMSQSSGVYTVVKTALAVEDCTTTVHPNFIKPVTKKPAKKASRAAPRAVHTPTPKANDVNHVVVFSESDCKDFLRLTTGPNSRLGHLHTVEIHLNGGQHSEYMDDYLAMALNAFHPRPDSTNPHKLETLKLVISGRVLFHRFNYVLVSPAVSHEVKSKLNRLMTSGLSIEEKADLAFKVNSTEKSIAKAILGIRGVKNVIIEHRGRAKMEPAFADIIKRTLVLSTSAASALSEVRSDTPTLNQEGACLSQKMRAQQLRGKKEYPTRNNNVIPASGYGTTRVLVDEAIQILGHFTNESEETTKMKAIEAAKSGTKRKIPPSDHHMIEDTTTAISTAKVNYTRTLRSSKRRKLDPETRMADALCAKVVETASADLVATRQTHNAGLMEKGVEDMVRIMSKPQDGEDLVLPKGMGAPCFINQRPRAKGTKNGEWLVLTGKGGMAQMGWNSH